MNKTLKIFKFIGRYYIGALIIGTLIAILGVLCIPFVEETWCMPLGRLLTDHLNIAVGIMLIIVGLLMPLLANKCHYKKQKWTYIGLDALIVVDGVLALSNIIGPNPIFALAFLIISVELFGYAFFKNPEEPKAAIDILEAGITAILLLIVVVCNLMGGFTFNHPVALPRTLGILILVLGLTIDVIALLFKLPKGSTERIAYDRENFHFPKHKKINVESSKEEENEKEEETDVQN